MKQSVEFGYPETLLIASTFLMLGDQFTVGLVLCILSVLSAIVRSAIRIQAQQQESDDKNSFYQQLNSLGTELANALGGKETRAETEKFYH